MKKKVVAVLLTGVIIGSVALAGCSGGDAGQTDTSSSGESKTETEGGTEADADQKAANEAAALIDAIYVQERTDMTDEQCKKAKDVWDALTDAQKELVEGENADPDYFGKDTGDA